MKQKIYSVGLLAAAVVSAVFSSPRWGIAIFDWVEPICLLAFFRLGVVRRKALWAFPALMLAHYLASDGVAPFPGAVVLLLSIYQSLLQIAIYGADAWVNKKTDRFAATLFFPAIAVVNEYMNTVYGGGVWWSVANSQYQFGWLTQVASVTGIWGISFLLYWTASVVVWAVGGWTQGGWSRGGWTQGGWSRGGRARGGWKMGFGMYGTVMALVVLWGCVRYEGGGRPGRTVKVAGVTVSLVGLYETFYSDYTGRRIVVDPRASVTDPVMGLVGQAEASYVGSADTARFRHAAAVIREVNDSLFSLSQQAADRGARIISWSEGNGIGWKAEETALVERGRRFAAQNKVYLLMTLCLVHPGEITPGKKFLENEAVLLGPDGDVLTRFHKNNPVPMVEASQPGDGIIPVLCTAVGKLAVSICYDADQPRQMQQLGRKNADLLLLPSGDWSAISNFHAHMAVYRGIENGCSVFREVSNGLSVAADYRGKVVGSRDWFRDGRSLWVAELPVGHVNTIYDRIGDVLPWGCVAFTLLTVVLLTVRSRPTAVPLATDRMALQP